jgi:phosphoglycerate dehydrogenase-like enzyme
MSTNTLPKAAFFGDTGPAGETIENIYGGARMKDLAARTDLYPTIVNSKNLEECLPELRNLQVIFATWGMLKLTEAHLDRMPNLRAVFYAAGSVRFFARPLLERGIIVVSCAASNAVPVAEFTVGQILLANKGYFRNTREYRAKGGDYLQAFRGQGNFEANVSLLGAGQIGRKVIELLQPYKLSLLVFDPFLSDADAASLGVEKVELAEAFARGAIVSNHLADLPQTVRLINGALFSSMPRDATFINTGRGATCDHDDLIRVFRERPDLTALLDVTDPEPLPLGARLWSLPNVYISGHIAGSIGNERVRNADYAIEEFGRWSKGEPLRYAVSLEAFDRTA